MKRILKLITVVLAILCMGGCSHITMLRTQELREVQTRVDSLHTELVSVHEKIEESQKTQIEMLRLLRADQQVRFNELDRKISAVEGNVSESHYKLSRIDEKTAEFKKQFEAKLIADSTSAGIQDSEIEKLFQIAKTDFNAGRYDIAKSGFEDLITQYPESNLVESAEYWIAESFYAKRDYNNAGKRYIEYIKKYPDGEKMSVTLYKLGLTYEKLNKVKSKNMVWKKLLDQYPESQEAKMVKVQMEG